jgi:hypothetical protein
MNNRNILSLFFTADSTSPGSYPSGSVKARLPESFRTANTCIFTIFRLSINASTILFIFQARKNATDRTIGIALKARNTTIGIIGMDNSVKYGLSVDDMDFMAILSHQLAAGIEKSRLFEKIQQLSQHDGLTGYIIIERSWNDLNRRSTDCIGPGKLCHS